MDSKLGFLSELAGVVQARSLSALIASAGAVNTGVAATSQLRSASLTMIKCLRFLRFKNNTARNYKKLRGGQGELTLFYN